VTTGRTSTAGVARSNGIDIRWTMIGNPEDPVLMTVMGLGVQMTEWDEAFVGLFVDSGFRVLLFDNRDCGLSSKVEQAYTLDDMADDAAGLLDALGLGPVHVFGMSMGGMIAQIFAIRYQERVLSLASVMSTTGAKDVGRTAKHLITVMTGVPAADNRAEVIAGQVAAAALVNGNGYPLDEDAVRSRMTGAYDRCYCPDGKQRQASAIRHSVDRTKALSAVRAPTVVIHGEDDPVIDVSGGRATAAAIPGARLLILPGMGHLIPAALSATVVAAVAANARRTQEP
jgi:pimeloyl-ACP methyl ester carboxylesterase